MKIKLSRGQFALIDECDAPFVSPHKWWAWPKRSKTGGWYAYTNIDRKTVLMHRLLLCPVSGVEVDHINRDGLDNRRANLRLCTRAQNAANRILPLSESGFRGVEFRATCRATAPYRAVIKVDGQRISGGLHPDAVSAALAYDNLARQHLGEFAVLNFPELTGVTA